MTKNSSRILKGFIGYLHSNGVDVVKIEPGHREKPTLKVKGRSKKPYPGNVGTTKKGGPVPGA